MSVNHVFIRWSIQLFRFIKFIYVGSLVMLALLVPGHAVNAQCNTWNQKVDFLGGARRGSVGLAIADKGYVGLGYDGASYLDDFWEYDPVSDTWQQRASYIGGLRNGATGFEIDGIGYVGGGSDVAVTYSDFYKFYPDSNKWVQIASFGGGVRMNGTSFSINGKGYYGTGYTGSVGVSDFWEYDPVGDAWVQKANYGGGIRYSTCGFSIGNKGYIGTGSTGSGKTKDFWEYDPVGDTWTQKANLGGVQRYGAAAFSIGDKGYIGTGNNGGNVKDFWEYDVASDTWVQILGFPGTSRRYAVSFALNGKGYCGTGYDNASTVDMWEYTPAGPTIVSESYTADLLCFGDSDGAVAVNAIGSDTIYYSIDGGTTFVNNSGFFGNLGAGSYPVAVQGPSGCTEFGDTLVISEPGELLVQSYSTGISCEGVNDGSAFVGVSGGILPYTYLWDAAAGSQVVDSVAGLSVGTYQIAVTDSNGCQATDSATVTGNPAPQTSSILGDSIVDVLDVATYSVGLTAGSTYSWFISGGNLISGGTSNSIEVQWAVEGTGVINVVETDSFGCNADTVILNVSIELTSGISSTNDSGALRIYPNPSAGVVYIDLTGISGEGTLHIYNSVGALELALPVKAGEIKNLVLENLTSGLYFFNFNIEQSHQTVSIRIE